jgi:hypothetical protein
MSKERKTIIDWALSIGLYPGILLGIRTYQEDNITSHVLYVPFVNLVLEIYKL